MGAIRPNIGLGYLAEVLSEANIEYDVFDMLLGYSSRDLKKRLASFKPDLVGLSLFSNRYKKAYETMAFIKSHFPSVKIVAGGPHISSLKVDVLKECRAIDYGIFLEGEMAILELCEGRRIEDIGNLIYRDGDEIVMNKARDFITDLDSIPFPKYSKFKLDRYTKEMALVSSRGCPYSCIYCAVKVVSGRAVRARSARSVADELGYWYKRGYRQFSFQDDNFTFSKKRVCELCDELQRRRFKDAVFRCAGSRSEGLDYAVLNRMRSVGFKTIAIGVEVGNDRLLEVIKKGERFEEIDRAVRLACELGFDVYLNFLAGVPYEGLSDIKESVDFALKYSIFYAEWSNPIPYPGTELYAWLLKMGYLVKRPEDYLNDNSTFSDEPVFETPELPYEVRKHILRRLKRMKAKILRRGIIRSLKEAGIPWGFLRHLIGYLASFELFTRGLFYNTKLRRFADSIRYGLYMKKG